MEGCTMQRLSWFLAVAFVFSPLLVHAQETDEPQSPLAEDRGALFASLAADVEALERQGNVLKRAVRYAKPSVVHIEAARVEGDRKTSEEAGSGTIVDIGGKDYVLT